MGICIGICVNFGVVFVFRVGVLLLLCCSGLHFFKGFHTSKTLGLGSPCIISQKKSYLKFALLISLRILFFVNLAIANYPFVLYILLHYAVLVFVSKHIYILQKMAGVVVSGL